MKNNIILETYPSINNNDDNFQDEHFTIFKISISNLRKILNTEAWEHITIKKFLNTYIWDDTIEIYNFAKQNKLIDAELIIKRNKLKYFLSI